MMDSQPAGRRPTPRLDLYLWHAAALSGFMGPIHEGDPKCGYFLRYNGRKSDKTARPPDPVEIYMEQVVDEAGFLTAPEKMVAVIAGRRVNPAELWTWIAKHPISRAEYMVMISQTMEQF